MASSLRTLALFPFLALACGQVLGIEEAQVDPTLLATTAGRSGSGGAGTTGTDSHDHGGTNTALGGSTAGIAGTSGTAGSAGMQSLQAGQGGDGGTDSGEAGAGGSGGSSESAAPTSCDRYCDAITQYCTNDYKQYRDREQCMAVCKLLPEGAVNDPDGNSASCRLKYADKARYAAGKELSAYCRQAGPGGNDRCGSNCEGFCSIMMATCQDPLTAPYFFKSISACMSTCAALPQIDYSYGDGTLADGNTVQCRIFHVTSAAMMDPEEHCAHAMGVSLCEDTTAPAE